MAETGTVVLLVDPDARLRSMLASQLVGTGLTVLQAADGATAMSTLANREVRLVVTELYVATGDDECLIHAIRRSKVLRKTRTLALTSKSSEADRDWAMRAGADAYLVKPTRPERLRYVVARLATAKGANASVPVTSNCAVTRRETLDQALAELERGSLGGTSSIVFGRAWWETLSPLQQTRFRKRAKKAGVSLRSDSVLGEHFVEVHARSLEERALSTERSESTA
jgi:twitching motility two-component system response regulator PilH